MRRLCFGLTVAAISAGAAFADSVEDFYKGKTISIIVGMAPPDQHDNDARLLARYMGKYIPGNPGFVVQNMPGAGSLKATQYIAGVAPKDGTTLGIVQRGVLMMPLLGYPEAQFDPTQLTFVGSRAPETSITVLWHTVPVKTIEDARKREIVLAGAGGGADGTVLPPIYNETVGTRLKVVIGYDGGGSMNLAIERGEVEGRAGWSMGAMRGTREDWYQQKKVHILFQHALRKHAELPDVPMIQDMAKDEASRQLLQLFAKRVEIGFPVFAPSGLPADRAAALRAAFDNTMKDPDYIADARKMQWEVNPLTGQQMQALMRDMYATPRAIVDRAKAILIAQGQKLN